MTKRRNFPARIRKAAYERAGGRCEECGCDLTGKRWDADHRRPDWSGGEPTLENCQILCSGGRDSCHGRKCAAEAASRSKADRCRKYMETGKGRARKGRHLTGGRTLGSKTWRRTIRGETVRRDA